MDFPVKLIKGGTILTVNNQKGYDTAIAAGFRYQDLSDEGHVRLVGYLETLLECAKAGNFHDFASNNSTPKIALRTQLLNLEQKVLDGYFDN